MDCVVSADAKRESDGIFSLRRFSRAVPTYRREARIEKKNHDVALLEINFSKLHRSVRRILFFSPLLPRIKKSKWFVKPEYIIFNA